MCQSVGGVDVDDEGGYGGGDGDGEGCDDDCGEDCGSAVVAVMCGGRGHGRDGSAD